MKRYSLLLLFAVSACIAPVVRPLPPVAPPDRQVEFTTTCVFVWQVELGRAIDPPALAECLRRANAGETLEQLRASVHDSAEAIAYRAVPVTPAFPSAGEAGYLHRDGILLRRDDGSIYQWRSATSFLLFNRFLLGEDIQDTITSYICSGTPQGQSCDPKTYPGANMVRVFGMLGGFGGSASETDFPQAFLYPHRHSEYLSQLDRFLSLLETRGMRVEFVVFADAQIVMPTQPAQTIQYHDVRAVLEMHWNSVGELANEFEKNGVNPAQFDRPSDHRVLWSAGSGLGDGAPFEPVWDYVPHHGRRNNEWPRDAKGSGDICCLGWSGEFPPTKTFVTQDEPMGCSENLDKIARGSRSNVAHDFGDFGATAAMWGGATLHTDSGVNGLPFNATELHCAEAFYGAMAFVPAEAPTWPYQRGDQVNPNGVGPFPLPVVHDDNVELRTFCKGTGTDEWCVQIRTTREHATARAGYVVVDEPRRGLVHLQQR